MRRLDRRRLVAWIMLAQWVMLTLAGAYAMFTTLSPWISLDDRPIGQQIFAWTKFTLDLLTLAGVVAFLVTLLSAPAVIFLVMHARPLRSWRKMVPELAADALPAAGFTGPEALT